LASATGSTAKHFVELLGERVRAGLNVVGVADVGKQPALRRCAAAFH